MPAQSVSAAALQGLAAPSHPRISIKGSRFRLVNQAGEETILQTLSMDCIIVAANHNASKVYFENEYDPSAENVAPTCWSDNGIGPSSSASKPQCGTCAACPNNVWGSATSKMTGKQTKACNDVKKLAIYVVGDGSGLLYEFRIPPASLKHLNAYGQMLGQHAAGGAPVDFPHVITRVSFDPNTTGVLIFEPVGWIPESYVVPIQRVWAEKAADRLTGITDRPFTGQLPAPTVAPAPQLAPPQAQPHVPSAHHPQATQPAPVQFMPQQAPVAHTPPPPPVPAAQTAAAPVIPSFLQGGAATTAPQPAPAQQAPAPRKRRTKAEMTADAGTANVAPQAAPAGGPAPEEIPAFLRRQPDAAAAPQPSAAAAHGMQTPAAPSAELQNALANAFNLPTT